MNLNFQDLNHLQVGRIGEYWIKLILTTHNLDTYYSDVDDKAIDFVVRLDNSRHIDIQVKTIRTSKTNYVFVTKHSWQEVHMKRDNLYMALVLLTDDNYPEAYLIPCTAWLQPNALLNDRKYSENGKKSPDEWGVSISKKSLPLLEPYKLSLQVEKIKAASKPTTDVVLN
jgi:hypothetical protein